MDGRIYDLKVGESFTIYGGMKLNGGVFTVESIIHDMAICVSEDSASRLIMPLYVGMPFAIQIFSPEKKKAPLPKKAPAEEAAPQENAGANEAEPDRFSSTMDFFMPVQNWGKIHIDGFPKGIFFHITQVEDEELRKYLASLPFGARIPKLKVSFQKCCNTERNNALCAGSIRLEEPLPDGEAKAKPIVECDGYLTEMACNGMLTILGCDNSREYRTGLKTAVDPYLKAYLNSSAEFGNLDSQGVKVHCFLQGRFLTRVEWINREEVLSGKEISLDEMVDSDALEKWNSKEPEESPAEDRPVPPYQALPLWKNVRKGFAKVTTGE